MGASGAALGLQGAGTGYAAYGDYVEGLAQQRYYKYKAAQNKTQQALVLNEGQQEANAAEDYGMKQTKILKGKVAETEGAQAAGQAASGAAGSVTATDIARDTFNKAKMDELAIKFNADQAAFKAINNSKLQAWQLGEEARGNEFAGEYAKWAGKRKAFSTLLSGSSQVASGWAAGSKYRT